MLLTVWCNNTDCPEFRQRKRVGRQHLGQHLYVGGAILCDCGNAVVELEES